MGAVWSLRALLHVCQWGSPWSGEMSLPPFSYPRNEVPGYPSVPDSGKAKDLCPLGPRHPPVPWAPRAAHPPPTAPHWSEAPASWGCARMPAFQPPLKISLPPIHRQLPPPCPRRIPFQLVHPGRAGPEGTPGASFFTDTRASGPQGQLTHSPRGSPGQEGELWLQLHQEAPGTPKF